MRYISSRLVPVIVVVSLLLLSVPFGGVGGCGGGGSTSDSSSGGGSTGDLSIEALVSTPTVSSLTVAGLDIVEKEKDSTMPASSKAITEAAQSGQEVHCEDLSGNKIGTPCTTDSTGKCKVTGLTEAQLTAGVVVVSGDGTKTPTVHAYEEPDAAAITAAKGGTPVSTTINTESDVAYAVIAQTASDVAGGDLSKAKDKIDPKCLRDAMQAMMGDDSAGTSDLGGYMEGMFQAHASSIAKGAVSGKTSADFMKDALAGRPEGMVGVVGKEVSKVPVADAALNFGKVIKQVKEAYCAKADASSKSPWDGVKEKAKGNFDPKAMCSLFKGFKPTEIGEYKPEYFKGFAQALPDLSGGFAMFGSHEQARRAAVSYFKQGAFNDPTKAGAALGMMASTFPPPPTSGAYAKMDFTSYDWDVGARAAYNGFLELTGSDSKGTYNNPDTIFSKFNSTYSDPTKRQSFAVGGSAACKEFIGGFVSRGGDFKPADFLGTIKSPPGGSCTTSADCLPCDSCSSKVCTSLSTKMGAECTTNSDCGSDGTLACTGGSYTGAKRNCMCASAMPKGMGVYAEVGKVPLYAGVAGGYAAPAAGAAGWQCGTGKTACATGYTCSDAVSGVCLPAGFKKAPFTACTAATECESGTCTGGLCTALTATQIATANTGTSGGTTTGSAIGAKTTGQPCASGSECSTFFCSAGFCGAPPTAYAGAAGTGSLKSNGVACGTHGECVSYYCATTCQAPPSAPTGGTGGTTPPPTGLAAGSYCSMATECSSKYCDYSTHKCL